MKPERLSASHTPSDASLQLVRQSGSKIRSDAPELAHWTENYLREHQQRLAIDLDLAKAHLKPGARVLDEGAAPLVTTVALKASGFRVSAVDLAPERFAGVIREFDLDVRRCDIEEERLPFADESFDGVLFNELFEHLRIDPIFTLQEVFRVLAPGGRLLLSTPNLRSFRGLKNLLLKDQGHAVSAGVYRQYEKLKTLGHMGHVREYTVTETVDFLGQTGFRPLKVIYRGGYGRGLVGFAERLAPSMRPFFSIVAERSANAAESA